MLRISIKSAKVYPGVDVATNHNTVVIKFDLKKIIPLLLWESNATSLLNDPVARTQLPKEIHKPETWVNAWHYNWWKKEDYIRT